eukprot:403353616
MKLIGKEWNALAPDQKHIYEEKAKIDRERYLSELQSCSGQNMNEMRQSSNIGNDRNYNGKNNNEQGSGVGESGVVKKTRRRRLKEKGVPKKVLSPYVIFVKEERPKMMMDKNTVNFKEIMSLLGQRWKEMSEDEKLPYRQKSEEDRSRHSDESKKYLEKKHNEMHSKEVRRGKNGQPKKPRTAYQIFAHVIRKKLKIKKPHANDSDISKAVTIEWAKLSGDQKRFYHEEAKLDKEKYEKAIEEWKKSPQNAKNRQMIKLDEKRKQSIISFISHGMDFYSATMFNPPASEENKVENEVVKSEEDSDEDDFDVEEELQKFIDGEDEDMDEDLEDPCEEENKSKDQQK